MLGEIADGGGDFTVVSLMLVLVLFELTVLLLVESVTITSVCATANEDITKSSVANFFVMVISYVHSIFMCEKITTPLHSSQNVCNI
jgi:hypothetical protein